MYDVVIIGAGVIGAMAARSLSRYNLSVCVVDKNSDVAMGATRANSGIIHAGFDAKEGSLKAKLNVEGCEMMKRVADELGVRYRNNGSLVIGFNEADQEEIQRLYNRGMTNGVKSLSILGKEQLFALEPNISKAATCALYAPTAGIICPYELNIAAIGNAMDNGVDLMLDFEVLKIDMTENTYQLQSGEKSITARYVINAAGVYADKIAAIIGDDSFSIHPRKGEYVLLDKSTDGLVSHTIFRTPTKMGKGILVSPTIDGNLLLGPTSVDITDKADVSTTLEGIEKIIKEASENVRDIPFRQVITSFSGLRATGSTGDFIITMPKKQWLNLAGIESPGLTAAPAIGEYAVAMLSGAGLDLNEKSDYNPYRKPNHIFQEMSIDEKNSVIRQNSAYGKIVCRCEAISEGEIVNAIHTNPKATTIDGVKRRTRSGMGRCQGGFCSPYILEILSREQNVPVEEINKSSVGSNLIYGRTKGGTQR